MLTFWENQLGKLLLWISPMFYSYFDIHYWWYHNGVWNTTQWRL